MNIAIQGEQSSFHDQAARLWFKDTPINIIPCDSFNAAFDELANGNADQALVAIDNTLYGSIDQTIDLIERHRFTITGEILLTIHQQLIALPGASLKDIKQVISHPVALAQCDTFLKSHLQQAVKVEYHDTAGAVRHIKELGDPTIAAIAGSIAAADYNLPILAQNIEDDRTNTTRFVIINRDSMSLPGANKTSLSLITDHSPGALAHVLSIFAKANVNLSKLESRPIPSSPWRYRFHLDIEVTGAELHTLLAHVNQTGATVTVLGEYRTGKTY